MKLCSNICHNHPAVCTHVRYFSEIQQNRDVSGQNPPVWRSLPNCAPYTDEQSNLLYELFPYQGDLQAALRLTLQRLVINGLQDSCMVSTTAQHPGPENLEYQFICRSLLDDNGKRLTGA